MLDHCDYLLDLHQTVSDAQDPFFIFQYASDRCLQIMEKINPGIPTILQFDQIGLNTGLSTDEYLRKRGKFGTALELGKKGSTHYFELGLSLCQNALDVLVPLDELTAINKVSFPMYRLDGRFLVSDNQSQLNPGWENMKPFKKGEVLGKSLTGTIHAPADGLMLFPRYRAVGIGQELFFYCTPCLSDGTSKSQAFFPSPIDRCSKSFGTEASSQILSNTR